MSIKVQVRTFFPATNEYHDVEMSYDDIYECLSAIKELNGIKDHGDKQFAVELPVIRIEAVATPFTKAKVLKTGGGFVPHKRTT